MFHNTNQELKFIIISNIAAKTQRHKVSQRRIYIRFKNKLVYLSDLVPLWQKYFNS